VKSHIRKRKVILINEKTLKEKITARDKVQETSIKTQKSTPVSEKISRKRKSPY
jgi:hypothetical protein